ncbi:URH2, partial [Symbiodinium sp. KB8]
PSLGFVLDDGGRIAEVACTCIGVEVDPQAILLQPSRAAAHLNLTYSYIKIRDRANAVRAIVQALRSAEDLSAADHRLLLWTKKDLAKVLASKRGTSNRFGASRGKSRPSSGSGKQPRRRPPATRQMMSRLEAWQMRKDLAALRSNDTAEETVAPWGRRHIYSEDSEQAISSKKASTVEAMQRQLFRRVAPAYSDLHCH